MGSNIERYAVLLAGPLLVCALAREPPRWGSPGARALSPALAMALA